MPIQLKLPRLLSSNLYLLVVAAWLITLSFIIDNYWSANSTEKTVVNKLNKYVQDEEKDFYETVDDSDYLKKIQNRAISDEYLKSLLEKSYYLFSYIKSDSGSLDLVLWNSQYVLPDPGIINSPQKAGFAQLLNGFYVWNKKDTAGVLSISLVPIKWNYNITNKYLKNTFANDPNIGLYYDIFPGQSKTTTIRTLGGTPLFYMLEKNKGANVRDNGFSILFRILGSLIILLFVHICAVYLAIHKRFLTGFIFLVTIILVIRIVSYFLPIPFNLRQLELFDPTVYGSNFILRSLGDLLINAGLFVWVVIFVRTQLHEKSIRLKIKEAYQRWILLIISSIIIVAATFAGGSIIRSLIADSQISFDVINFFSLNIYSVVGFAILCCIAIGYYFLCQTIVFLLKPHFVNIFPVLYLAVCIAGLTALTFGFGSLIGSFAIYTLIWLMLFLFLLNTSYLDLLASRIVSSKMVFWIFFFSVSISIIIISENNRKELRNRNHYAEILATKADPTSQSLLNSMLTDFRLDFLADNFERLKSPVSNKVLKDSLINNNFSGYKNRYDTEVYSFDNLEQPLYNEGHFDYNQLNTILNSQARSTNIAGLYYYDESFDRFSYISKKNISDTAGKPLGAIFIVVTPKTIKNEMIYPELFSKGIDNAIENSSLYSFAVYNKGKLISSHNDYPFATTLPGNAFHGKQYYHKQATDHDELWYNAGGEKFIVIVKENRVMIESITLFSYIFCSFLLLGACFWLISVFINSRFDPQKLRTYWQLTIRNQIHGVIIFISLASFLVIGTATILFFINRYETTNRDKLSRAIQIMKNQVNNSLQSGWTLTDSLSNVDRVDQQVVEKSLLNIAEIHGVDVNIYDLKGDLKISSLPLPYIKGIVSIKMEPVAYLHLNTQKEVQYFQKEHIGNLKFLSSYVPINDVKGNTYSYLNIPYFTSQSNLQQEIANFLVTIINLNAFIFLIAGIVALFIATRITHSFAVIGEKMKKINLGTHNEAIEWNRNDEIGSLVGEYNKMVSKLDESAAAMAKTEREGAWREMAKQVAHEIKNPLTPMKLSMQFLQRSIETNAPDVKELTTKVANTLVEQIDHLSKIASEFSQFANIEQADKAAFDLNESLESIRQLHDSNEEVTISWQLQQVPVIVYADKTHINRLFTNLILNALQSVPDSRRPQIEVQELLRGDHVLVKIKDNGEGISEAVQSKIFAPNFTTKTSGTGLGLAMSKRIVEQAGGSIWFETLEGEGTSFFVSLPVAGDKV
ncbi:MAG: HAMP domain-containing histidine kinase [Rhizobacter sp.]|nr:HAMP domain-containing histidine kinase [Ferruginibacter sp.]